MKCFKHLINEETMQVEVIEFGADHESDFSHDPKTNFYESLHSHYTNESDAYIYADNLNREIADSYFKLIKCKDCGIYFLLPASEAGWFLKNQMNLPKRCPDCRSKRKRIKNSEGN